MATILKNTPQNIQKVIHLLSNKGVASLCTETVYGLAANSLCDEAVLKVFELKQRPANNPLILHFYSLSHVEEYFYLTDTERKLAKAFWAGPLTIVLHQPTPKAKQLSRFCNNKGQSWAVRVPNCTTMQYVIQQVNAPLAAPSANPFNQLSPTTAQHVAKGFLDKDLLILDEGQCQYGLESTIVKVNNQQYVQILREGAVTGENLQANGFNVLGANDQKNYKLNSNSLVNYLGNQQPVGEDGVAFAYPNMLNDDSKTICPGQLKKHYSPNTPLIINQLSVQAGEALLAFGDISKCKNAHQAVAIVNLSTAANLTEAAYRLFDALWYLDSVNATKIVVMPVPNEGLGRAINERLQKASVQ